MATSTTELTYSTNFGRSLLSSFIKNAPRFAWRSFAAPKNVYKRCNFLRVVHSCETESILKEIGELQGANGIFFAGAYSVEGMGLLEQAALSGGNIVERINKLSKLKI